MDLTNEQTVTINMTPQELWIAFHRINQSCNGFWDTYGHNELGLKESDNDEIKHELWFKLNEAAKGIDLDPMKPFEDYLDDTLHSVAGESLEVSKNGDVKVGCKEITYQDVERIYEMAKKAREDL